MAPDTNGIHIEEEGFITTKKGFTLSSMSLFIWVLTGILFKLSDIFFTSIDYQTFCFFVSLLLSGLSGFYLTNRLVKKASGSSKILLAVANILLLYTSANGIQSGYCFLSSDSYKDSTQQSALIPFMIAKPWLPDKFQATIIEGLEVQNKVLDRKVVELESYTADKSELIKEIEKLKSRNQVLADSIKGLQINIDGTSDYWQIKEELKDSKETNKKLETNLATLQTRLDETSDYFSMKQELERLKNKNRSLIEENNDLKNNLSENSTKAKELVIQNKNLNESVSKLKDHLGRLTQRINNNNSLQKKWQRKLASNDKLMTMKGSIIEYFGQEYYSSFFENPISIE